MRRRLALVALATVTLVVLTFLIPLGLLVRRQAEDRARVDAEREAQAAASIVALAVVTDSTADGIGSALGPLEDGIIIVLEDGSTIGSPHPGQGSLTESARDDQATITSVVDGGWEIALPVISPEGVIVVDVMATDAELTDGVTESWALLLVLGVVIVSVAVWLADRLARSLVRPIKELEEAAHLLGTGDLSARVSVEEPQELAEVAEAFNSLAGQLHHLLKEEREGVADLSHRLRTPLTSLRLAADSLNDDRERTEVVAMVDRLERSIDQLILAARAGQREVGLRANLDEVVSRRSLNRSSPQALYRSWATTRPRSKRSLTL